MTAKIGLAVGVFYFVALWRGGPCARDAGMARPAVRLCAVYRILAISHYRILNLYLCLFGLYVRSNNSDIGVIAAMLLIDVHVQLYHES